MARMSMTPPRLTPLVGRASPAGSKNFGGTGKGIDMPNKSASVAESTMSNTSPLGVKLGSNAPYKHTIPTSFGPNRSFG